MTDVKPVVVPRKDDAVVSRLSETMLSRRVRGQVPDSFMS